MNKKGVAEMQKMIFKEILYLNNKMADLNGKIDELQNKNLRN